MTMFPVIDVADRSSARASAHSRGVAYGRAARAQVGHSIATCAGLFAACGMAWAEASRRALHYVPAIDALDADLTDELRGIAAGSAPRS